MSEGASHVAAKQPASAPNVSVIEQVESESRRTILVVFGVLLVMAIAIGTYYGVKHSLKEVRAVALQARLDAELRALDVWIRQESNRAVRWANDQGTRALMVALVEAAARDASASPAFCSSDNAIRLRELLRAALSEKHFATFNVIDRSGRVVAAYDRTQCAKRVSTRDFLSRVERIFDGNTAFVRPMYESDRLPDLGGQAPADPLLWITAPVLDDHGRAIAALAFAEHATGEFAALLRPAVPGESDELLLFDDRAVLLSDSRHADKLAAVGAIKDPKKSHTMLEVEVRIPRGEKNASLTAEERSAQPRTRLAALAIASRWSKEPSHQRGVLIEPYRNYYGAEVVGAWRWLPEYDVGAALEIEAAEAYAPVKFLDRLFAVVLGLSAAAAVGVVIAVFSNLRLRRGLGRVRRLGRYTLTREIGEGGMASVYLGRHALLKRPIAIKILKRALATDEIVARFEREVQLASQLTHPNTIHIYDYGHTRGGDFYYVMEYLQGITLAEMVARDGAQSAARTMYLLRQVCAALREAHARGIVHRDIKPENIMACVQGGEYDVVKVLDFGLVKSMTDEVSRDITQSVKVLGTPAYMAPERFANAGVADERSDIYAVGAVAYLLLSGKRIFQDAAGDDLQLRILHAQPVPLAEACARPVPRELADLMMQCLAKKPQERPESVAKLMATLESLALSEPWSQAQAAQWWKDHGMASDTDKRQETE